jgi:hypothetical protein
VSGISGKRGTIAFAVQSAKGVAATAPTHRYCLSGDPTLGPVKNRGRYSMTDSSQDRGPAYTSLMAVEGDVPVYLHPQGVGLLFGAVLGSNADSGAGPDYTHEQTPAEDMLWLTAWREIGGVIFEKFVDVKIGNLQIEGDAGNPWTMTASVIGCEASFLDAGAERTALLDLDPFDDAGYLYPEAENRIKLATVAEKIHRLSIGINRNASGYQSDGYGYDDVDPGEREITLSFATRFQSGAIGADEYRTFFYGSAAGTALDPAVGTQAFEVEIVRDASTSLKIELPQVTYAGVPVNASPGGEPIEVEVACEVEKPTDGSPIVTVTVKDQKSSINV